MCIYRDFSALTNVLSELSKFIRFIPTSSRLVPSSCFSVQYLARAKALCIGNTVIV